MKEDFERRLSEIREQEDKLAAQRRYIYRESLEAPDEDKLCPDGIARSLSEPSPFKSIEYPITINAIAFAEKETLLPTNIKWVSVRPCSDKYEGKTYLGIMLGDMALSVYVSFNHKTGILHAEPSHHNPAMYVPELNEVIYGCGSYWGEINSPEDLKQISKDDINNIWYVRAIKEMNGIDPDAVDEEEI